VTKIWPDGKETFSIITLPCRSSIFTLERTKGSVPIAHSKMCRNRIFPRMLLELSLMRSSETHRFITSMQLKLENIFPTFPY
jgi:hypothetical protein